MHTCWIIIHPALPPSPADGPHGPAAAGPVDAWLKERQSLIETALAPFRHTCHHPQESWDWYQIGGRWSGLLDGFNPQSAYHHGPKLPWPTEWPERPEDTQLIESWPKVAQPYQVLFPDGRLSETHYLAGQRWIHWQRLAKSEWPGCQITVVDTHG